MTLDWPKQRREIERNLWLLDLPRTLTPEEAKTEFDIDIEPDWTLNLFQEETDKGWGYSFTTVEGWDVFPDDTFLSPEGKRYTREELETSYAAMPPEISPIQGLLERLFPEFERPEQLINYATEFPERFVEHIKEYGAEEDVRSLLALLSAPEEYIEGLYAPIEAPRLQDLKFIVEVGGVRKLATIDENYSVLADGEEIGAFNPETGKFDPLATSVPRLSLDDYIRAYFDDKGWEYAFHRGIASDEEVVLHDQREREAAADYRRRYGTGALVSSGFAKIISFFYSPGRVIAPEIEWKDITPAEHVFGVGQAALWLSFPLAAWVAPLGIAARIAVTGIQGIAATAFTAHTVMEWENMSNTGRAISVLFDVILFAGFAYSLYGTAKYMEMARNAEELLRRQYAGQVGGAIKKIKTGILQNDPNAIRQGGAEIRKFAEANPSMRGRDGLLSKGMFFEQRADDIIKMARGEISRQQMEQMYEAFKGNLNYARQLPQLPAGTAQAQQSYTNGIINSTKKSINTQFIAQTGQTPAPAVMPPKPPVSEIALMEIPPQQDIINSAIKDNWLKNISQKIAKVPYIGPEVIRRIDPRLLLSMDDAAVEAIVAKNAIGFNEIIKMGINARTVLLNELRAISTNPVKLFGFNKNAYSVNMENRLLPEFKDLIESGTLEHIFTHPEMYNWQGFQKGLEYVKSVRRVNIWVQQMMIREGVDVHALSDDWWIHRVVEGKYDANGELSAVRGRPGVRGRMATKRSFEMKRKAATMLEGMLWKIKYAENPELAVSTFIEEGFVKMAQKRFFGSTDKALEEIGMPGKKPSDLLEELYPDLIKRFELTKDELAQAANFHSVINRALRGEKIPEQTLKALERRFPELVGRFREATTRKDLLSLRKDVIQLTEEKKAPYWKAKANKVEGMSEVSQPALGKGRIIAPHFSGKIYDQAFVDAYNKFFGHKSGLNFLNPIADIEGILVTAKASLDLSFPAIQGMPAFGYAHSFLATDPKKAFKLMGSWLKSFLYPIRAYSQPGWTYGILQKNTEAALQRISFGGSSRAVDFFQALHQRKGLGGFVAKIMSKIPFQPYDRAELAFYGAGEIIRNEFWGVLSPDAIKNGQEFQLAQLLDRMTGLINTETMGIPVTQRLIERTFGFFAPQYTRACLSFLSNVFRGGYTGAFARRSLGGLITAGALYYAGMQYALASLEGKEHEEAWDTVLEGFGLQQDPITKEWEWRPTARFMSIKVGNYNFGIGGFWYGLVRLAGNIMACIQETGDKEVIDLARLVKQGELNKDNPFLTWWWGRAAIMTHLVEELWTHKDFLGYPIETPQEYARYVIGLFEPIWVEQGVNWMIPGMVREHEIPEGAARTVIIPAEIFGLRTFPESMWVKFYDKTEEYINRIPVNELEEAQLDASQAGKLKWGNLTSLQKINLLFRYPELQEIYEKAQADNELRQSPLWKEWTDRQDADRTTYYDRGTQLIERLITGDIDTRELREKWGDAGQNYGAHLDALEKEPKYAFIYEYFERIQAERGEKYGFVADLALAEYIDIMFSDYTDEKGDFDWDARDVAIDGFVNKWGQEYYEAIKGMYAQKKLLEGLPDGFVRLSDDKDALGRDYWRLPYKPIKDMDEDDRIEGNIPDEYLSLWQQASTLEGEQLEAFLDEHPELGKDWRQEYRLNHTENDARLSLWGYGGKLQTMDAYNKVVDWGKELGIPLEQMGLGLPPPSLIGNYFDLNKIISETSGGSAETKIYKLGHPQYLAFGVEEWGWSDLSNVKIEVLTIDVRYREEDDWYNNGIPAKHADIEVKEDRDAAIAVERHQYLLDNETYRKDSYRRDAFNIYIPTKHIETYVNYHTQPTREEAGVPKDGIYYAQERLLLAHNSDEDDYYQAVWLGLLGNQDVGFVPSKRFEDAYNNEYLPLAIGTARYEFRGRNTWFDEEGQRVRGWKPYVEKRVITPELKSLYDLWAEYNRSIEESLAEVDRLLEE